MKIAVISDIHGNILALEAVLKDVEARGAAVYCTGDLVGYGPRPNEVVDRLRKSGIPTVMGNYDDAIGNMRIICGCDYKDEESLRLGERSIAWTAENTSPENKKWLTELPGEIIISTGGISIMLVHGSPRALNEYLYESTPEALLEELLKESKADVLVCGHTHLPFFKKTAAGHIINAGSVGKPKHGNPNATYIVLSTDSGRLEAAIIEVPYNHEEVAADIERSGLPRKFAEIIRTGRP